MKKTAIRPIVLLLILSIGVFAGSAVAQESSEPVTITVTQWHTMEAQFEGPFMEIVAAFEAENPDIKVDVVGIPWGDTTPQLTIRTGGGTPPDVALVNSGDPAIFAAMGALAPIVEVVSAETLEQMQWAKGALIDAPSYQGIQYGFTWYVFTFPMQYNKNVMTAAGLDPDSPPATWEEFLAAIIQVGEAGDGAIGLGGNFTQGSWGGKFYAAFLWAHGADVLDVEGNVIFDSPEAVAALQELVDVYQQSPNAIGFGTGNYEARLGFSTNQVAFMREAGWIRTITRDLSGEGDAFDDDWGVAPWPAGHTYTGGHVWVVFQQSENKEAAGRFIEFVVTNREMQEKWSQVFGSIPPIQEFHDFAMYDDPFFDEFLVGLGTGRSDAPHPLADLVATYLSIAFTEALSGTASPEDALKRAANNARIALGQPMQ